MGEVLEAEGGAAEVFQSAIDRFGGPVRGVGSVEVAQDVGGSLVEGRTEGDDFLQGRGNPGTDGRDEFVHSGAAGGGFGFAVGGDHLLVHAPGGFEFDVIIAGE